MLLISGLTAVELEVLKGVPPVDEDGTSDKGPPGNALALLCCCCW